MSLSQGEGGDDAPRRDVPVEVPTEAPADLAVSDPPNIAEEDSAAPQSRPSPRLCVVCNIEAGKYKCPRCTMLYCSVACNRIHKENHPAMPEPDPDSKQQPPAAAAAQEPRSPFDVLLDHRAEFTRLFTKYPFLQSDLLKIHQTTLPPQNTTAGSASFALPSKQHLLNGGKKQPSWSRETGLRQGAAALRKARTDPGDTGDGVREFCDLVLYLLSNPSGKRAGEAGDVTSLVREEVVAEETKTIEQLLREESDDRDR